MSKTDSQILVETYRRPLPNPKLPQNTIFNRLKAKDRTAVTECLATYGSILWAFAKEHSATFGAAEILTEQIFLDIWKYAECHHCTDATVSERTQIGQIAVRRLVRNKYEIGHIL